MNLKEVPKLDQSAMMKMLIDKGPFSKWLSYKSQITKADIEEVCCISMSHNHKLKFVASRLKCTPADQSRMRLPQLSSSHL